MAPSLAQAHEFQSSLAKTSSFITSRFTDLTDIPVTPSKDDRESVLLALPQTLADTGLGTEKTVEYLLEEVVKGLHTGHAGPRYYGFVCGGVTPASQLADIIVGSLDENVQVTLPQATLSTAIENLTTLLVLDLLRIPRTAFEIGTVTTGATASNILGITCARDALLLASPHLPPNYSISEFGYPFHPTGGPVIQILSAKPHGSLLKSAAVTGIGRLNVVDCSLASSPFGLGFDMKVVETRLKEAREQGRGVIVHAGIGEVNTGASTPGLRELAEVCRKWGGWLHVDAAFGGFGALVPGLEYLSEEMALADSLTLDGHKWLQAPYDTALFYTRHRSSLVRSFGPSPTLGAPAYLAPPPRSAAVEVSSRSQDELDRLRVLSEWQTQVESPLNCGIENSRRFRALPLFAGLVEHGKEGYSSIINRNVDFACSLANWILDPSPTGGAQFYTLLNHTPDSPRPIPLNIVLFCARESTPFPPSNPASGVRLTAAINEGREVYVSATSWAGKGAVRVAVSNWRTGAEEQVILRRVLREAMKGGQ